VSWRSFKVVDSFLALNKENFGLVGCTSAAPGEYVGSFADLNEKDQNVLILSLSRNPRGISIRVKISCGKGDIALRHKKTPELPLECSIAPEALGVMALFGAHLGEYDCVTSCG
jgi:hypothetical protein